MKAKHSNINYIICHSNESRNISVFLLRKFKRFYKVKYSQNISRAQRLHENDGNRPDNLYELTTSINNFEIHSWLGLTWFSERLLVRSDAAFSPTVAILHNSLGGVARQAIWNDVKHNSYIMFPLGLLNRNLLLQQTFTRRSFKYGTNYPQRCCLFIWKQNIERNGNFPSKYALNNFHGQICCWGFWEICIWINNEKGSTSIVHKAVNVSFCEPSITLG